LTSSTKSKEDPLTHPDATRDRPFLTIHIAGKELDAFASAMAVTRLRTGENKAGVHGEGTAVKLKMLNRFLEPLNKESGNHVFLQCR
jgi:hypothetical protein